MKKVVIVSYYFNQRDTDRSFAVLNYFTQAGFDVVLLCGNYDHNSKSYVNYGIDKVIQIPVMRYEKNISFQRKLSYLKFGFDVKKRLENMSFDIGYVVGPPNSTGFILYKTIKLKNALLVTDIYDLYPETIPISREKKKILKYLGFGFWSHMRDSVIKKADIFIGSCDYYFTDLGLSKNRNNHMVPLCKGEAMLESPSQISNSQLRFVYLGAITGNYDFEGLVFLLSLIMKKNRNVHLDIIGEGGRREWLLEQLENKQIPYDFHGRIYDDQMKLKIMDQCQFGFNGFKEDAAIALSYKSMEYMANGLALINSCKEDTWKIVESENIGINYRINELNLCAETIVSLGAEQIFEMRKQSLRIYNERFAWHNFVNHMDNIFVKNV